MEYADEWKKLDICSIGWQVDFCKCKSENDVQKLMRRHKIATNNRWFRFIWRFLEMRRGDIVLAYCRNNVIAYVGTITGRCEYNKDISDGNYRKTEWWTEPYYFSRHDLPKHYSEQFLREGEVVKEILPDSRGVEGFKETLRTDAKSGSMEPGIEEDTVKADIVKHLRRDLNTLEEGLNIKKANRHIGESSKRPDFIGEDKQGRSVLIECKGVADARTVDQILEYGKKSKKGSNPRLIIVASRVSEECLKSARKAGNIELFETQLTFRRKN